MPHMKQLLLFLLCACLFLTFLSGIAIAATPTTSCECSCLYLPQNNTILYDKNANRRHPMASTTKIMTALVALENSAPSDEVIVSPMAVGIEGSSIYLTAGEHQTMEALLYALLLESANDAAAAIAIHLGGSIEGFANMMNKKAAELGLCDTHFTNPHGLADDEHYTTAAELARMTACAMENPHFREIVATRRKTITVNNGEGVRALSNHNKLLRAYPDCIGVKTGFTKKSGRCLVSAAERDGMLLIAVTLDAPDDWRDHTAMLDFGFSLYEGRIPCTEYTTRLPLLCGTKDSVSLSIAEPLSFVMRKNEAPIEVQPEVNRFVIAPVEKGQALGRLLYKQNGKTIASVPLLCDESIAAKPVRLSLWDKIKRIFNM